jgi:RNA polymerase sigma-70 factor (subfamily 1)
MAFVSEERSEQSEASQRPRARALLRPETEAGGPAPSTSEAAGDACPGAYASLGLENEGSLVEGASGGDEDALCALLAHYGPLVRDRLKHKIGPQWRTSLDEDDVMQVTYLEAFLLIGQFRYRGPGSFLAWLSQVAENNLRDALRGLQAAKRPNPKRRVQVAKHMADNSFVALVELLGATESTPSRAAARDESEQIIERTLSALPPDYERVVRLYDLECRSAQEVAEQLGRSPGAIYMLRARAHERMRSELGNASQFFTDPGR